MVMLYDIYQQPWWFVIGFLVLMLWTMVWQGIGLWYAAKHQQKGWYIALFVLNTLGLLPIIYLIWFKPRERQEPGKTFIEERKSVTKKSRKK